MHNSLDNGVLYDINQNVKNRLNILKLYFSIMVVFIHVYSNVSMFYGETALVYVNVFESIRFIISKIISRVAVPGFFLISSILLYRKEFIYIQNIKKKIRTVLIPYIILNTIWLMFYIIIHRIPILSQYFKYDVNEWDIFDYINVFVRI